MRIVMGEEDLQITKISSVFKVSSRVPLSANSPTFYTHRAVHALFIFLMSLACMNYT